MIVSIIQVCIHIGNECMYKIDENDIKRERERDNKYSSI